VGGTESPTFSVEAGILRNSFGRNKQQSNQVLPGNSRIALSRRELRHLGGALFCRSGGSLKKTTKSPANGKNRESRPSRRAG
jgi:hypothetical protein